MINSCNSVNNILPHIYVILLIYFDYPSGKKTVKGKDQPKEEKLKPTDDELREAICEILKEVDFNTVRI